MHICCTFAMRRPSGTSGIQIQSMYKIPRASKACASKVLAGDGFVAQVLVYGIPLCCLRTAGCPGMSCRGRGPVVIRSGLSGRPFYRVMSTVLHGPLASAVCRCVLLLALASGVDTVQFGVSHGRFAAIPIPVSECQFFSGLCAECCPDV